MNNVDGCMMEEKLNVPLPIQNEQSVIWRFMDFTKFVSVLDKGSLFLCRADKLDDSFEGSSTELDFKFWKSNYLMGKIREGKMGNAMMQQNWQEISDGFATLKKLVNINSWYMKEYESAAMWNLYAQTKEAVAIKSSCKRLRKSLPDCDQLLIGQVKYIDYKKERMEEKCITDRFFYKRKSYEHEEEIRIILLKNLNGELPSTIQAVETEGGVYVETQIDTLIEKVYVAPNSPDWFRELVKRILKLYGFHKEVIRTSLDDKALY